MSRLVATLVGLVLLAACSSAAPGATTAIPATSPARPATSASASPSTAASAPTPTEPATKAVTITLADGKAEPNGERVELVRGQHLVLTITSDRDDEVHVHGFDLEIPVSPGESVTRDIRMDRVGRFKVESHEPVLTLLVLTVR